MRKQSRKFSDDTEGKFCGVAAAVVGGAVIGGVASNMAAGTAADAQENAANQSNALSQAQYNQTRQDQMPWMTRGNQAGNQLQYLLGLSPLSNGAYSGPSRQDIFNQYEQELSTNGIDVPYSQLNASDKAGRDATVDSRFAAAQQAAAQSNLPNAINDPAYGSLTRKFSASDLAADVPYQTGMQFGLDQGTQGINRLAAASGSLNSGATLKALAKFGNDYGNQQAGAAYNRYTNDQSNTYNKLAGVAGTGQTAVNQIGAAGQANATSQGNTAIGLGNARGASAIAQGNALSSGANSISNYYQQQQLLNQLQNGGSGGYNGYVNNSQANGFGNTFTQNGYSADKAYG